MKQRLKEALSRRQKSRIFDSSRTPSAVLVPIYYKEGEYYILFTQRTETLKDHKGQVSFPGGACEKEDGTPLNTALRECAEEIGLAAGKVELLGELDDFLTTTSNYVISPFVAAVSWPYQLKIDPIEVAEIIEVPMSALLDKECVRQDTDILYGKPITAYFYQYKGKVIWGATARILHQFLGIWAEVMKDTGE